jgi:hypothetical protein
MVCIYFPRQIRFRFFEPVSGKQIEQKSSHNPKKTTTTNIKTEL